MIKLKKICHRLKTVILIWWNYSNCIIFIFHSINQDLHGFYNKESMVIESLRNHPLYLNSSIRLRWPWKHFSNIGLIKIPSSGTSLKSLVSTEQFNTLKNLVADSVDELNVKVKGHLTEVITYLEVDWISILRPLSDNSVSISMTS